MSKNDSRQVADIMEMYWALKIGYDKLEDKSGIDEIAIDFRGFDHNSESNQLAYANFLQKQGSFTEIGHGNLDQGVLTMQMYKRMLEVWDTVPDDRRWPLSKDDIQRIVAAQVHPDNREPTA